METANRGRWEWQGDTLSYMEGDHQAYWIDAGRFQSVQDLIRWHFHMGQKTWVTKADLQGLVAAFAERHGFKVM